MKRAVFQNLIAGQAYIFHTKDFEVPTGGVVLGEAKRRTFIREESRGCAGCPSVDFLVVRREDGSKHLIAVEEVRAIDPA